MKKFTKTLALLLALLIAFGVSASAEDIPEYLELDSLPELALDQVITGSLDEETPELWYRFTAEESGYYHFTVEGARYELYYEYEDGQFAYPERPGNTSVMLLAKTWYVRIYPHYTLEEQVEFTLTVEHLPYEFWTILEGMLKGMLADFSENGGIIGLLATIGRLPLLGFIMAFFFLPFSMGGSLLLVPISILFLPVTLLMSPFMLIDSIRSIFV